MASIVAKSWTKIYAKQILFHMRSGLTSPPPIPSYILHPKHYILQATCEPTTHFSKKIKVQEQPNFKPHYKSSKEKKHEALVIAFLVTC